MERPGSLASLSDPRLLLPESIADRIAGMDADLLSRACRLYDTSTGSLSALSGGNYNATYRYPIAIKSGAVPGVLTSGAKERHGVLRIGVEDCPIEQTLGMLEWVRFLSEQGAPVTAPILSSTGHLLERVEQDGKAYTITAFEAAEGRLAERIAPNEWTDELFRSIGYSAGRIHAVSKHFQPSRPELRRPDWYDSYEIRDARKRFAVSGDPALEKLTALVTELKRLPVEPGSYGMIHDDLHFANFLVQPGGEVAIIDFDDCAYGWFAMDIAMALFDVLVLYNAPTETEKQAFARSFMHHYLCGYREKNELDPFWQAQIPQFLKLKELCVYAPLIGHAEINQLESWVGRFMHGRAERVVNDIPYVDINFENI